MKRIQHSKDKYTAKSFGVYGVIGILIAGMLLAVMLAHLLVPDKAISEQEKRVLSKPPHFSVSALEDGSFMEEAEDYVTDQFPARDFWMKLKMTISFALGQRLSNGVYYLQDDSLAEGFDVRDEKITGQTLAAMSDFAARHPESNMYFMPVPTRAGMAPGLFPAHGMTADQNTFLDYMLEAVQGIHVIELRDAFRAAADHTLLYYRSDHHWTSDGAYIAYGEAAEAMGLVPGQYTRWVVHNTFQGSLAAKSGFSLPLHDTIVYYASDNPASYIVRRTESAELLSSCFDLEKLAGSDPYEFFFGGNYPMIEIETAADNQKCLLVLKDSYANAFVPFLIESYSKIIMVDPRYYAYGADALFLSNTITDVLFLYNVNTLANDTALQQVLTEGMLP